MKCPTNESHYETFLNFQTQSLELPAITICPKIADAFNLSPLFSDMRTSIPEITDEQCIDLLRFWIGGTGFENMKPLQTFNETYLSKLNEFYHKWSKGYTYEQFFNTIHVSWISIFTVNTSFETLLLYLH